MLALGTYSAGLPGAHERRSHSWLKHTMPDRICHRQILLIWRLPSRSRGSPKMEVLRWLLPRNWTTCGSRRPINPYHPKRRLMINRRVKPWFLLRSNPR